MGLQLDRLYAQALERGPEQSCPSSYRCWLVLRQHSNRTRTDWDASLAENGARRAGPEEGPKKRSGGRKRSWSGRMAISWPDSVDEILVGDDVVMLGYLTPATGVVLTPVTNFAVRDRRAGTFTVNSSIGAWKKLERIRRRPEVRKALAEVKRPTGTARDRSASGSLPSESPGPGSGRCRSRKRSREGRASTSRSCDRRSRPSSDRRPAPSVSPCT